MVQNIVIERLYEALIDGDRKKAQGVIDEQFEQGADAEIVIAELLWPTYELIDRLFREDTLSTLSRNMAVKLLRVFADRCGERLEPADEPAGRTVLAFSGQPETEELGAQMAIDILDAAGFQVRYAGGGVANDEILAAIHARRPDVLLAFCSAAADLPDLRSLIDNLHEIGACPDIQIVVGGGVFNRADGLAEEIGADLWAADPLELASAMVLEADHRAPADQRTVGRIRRPRLAA